MIIHNVEQGTPEWFALRAGMPTASEFSKIVTSVGEASKSMQGYAITLAGEMYAGKPLDVWEGNSHTERGKVLEEEASKMYAFLHDVEPAQVGFVTTDDALSGCSPDRFIGDDGLTEIKCLKAENHIKAIMYYKKHKKCPPDYVQQTQGQMFMCERAWCDLFFYHPDLPRLTIRVERDDKFINCLKDHIGKVIIERDRILSDLV